MKNITLKLTIIFLCLVTFTSLTYAKTYKSRTKKHKSTVSKPVSTLNKIKTLAFKDVKTTIPLSFYHTDLNDKYYKSNLAYIQNIPHKRGNEPPRQIFPSYCGSTFISYGIRYDDKPNNVYHYNSSGELTGIEIDHNNPATYPKKTVTYNNTGKLHTVVYYVSSKEQYNFNGTGTLIVHWIGEKAYNREGKLMKIRRSF